MKAAKEQFGKRRKRKDQVIPAFSMLVSHVKKAVDKKKDYIQLNQNTMERRICGLEYSLEKVRESKE